MPEAKGKAPGPAAGDPPAAGRRTRSRSLRSIQSDLDSGKPAAELPEATGAGPTLPDATGDLGSDAAAAAARAEAAGEAFDFAKWHDAQPIEAREQYTRNVLARVSDQLKTTYGEAIDLLNEAAEQAAKGDTTLLDNLKKLKDNKRREFVFGTAYRIYDEPVEGETKPTEDALPPAVQKRIDDLEAKVGETTQRIQSEDEKRAQEAYMATRREQLAALTREFPELQYSIDEPTSSAYLRVADIIDRTEAASQAAGKVVPYRETYEKMRRAWSATGDAPRPAPRMASAPNPANTTAPTTEVESRQRMRDTIARYGSFSDMARQLPRGARS